MSAGLIAKAVADIKAIGDRLTSTWSAKLDTLHTLLSSAWAAKVDLLNARLDDDWANGLDATVSSRAAGADYTANRAAKLDNLDGTILSRAPSNTALSTGTWTSQRAANLDSLDAAITTRAAAATALSNAIWTDAKAGYLDAAISTNSIIKSIQTGLIDTSTLSSGSNDEAKYKDVTITAVTTTKAMVLHQILAGQSDSGAIALTQARQGKFYGSSDSNSAHARAYLTSGTNLRIYTGLSGTYVALSGRWWVIEFK